MKPNWQHIMNAGSCPEPQKLESYYYGQLSDNERFTIENHLADCEMCSDYVEGLSILKDTSTLPQTEVELKQKIHGLLEKKDRKLILIPIKYKRLAIAASILIIVSISFVMYYQLDKPIQQLAEQVKEVKKTDSSIIQKDTFVLAQAETKKVKPVRNSVVPEYQEQSKTTVDELPVENNMATSEEIMEPSVESVGSSSMFEKKITLPQKEEVAPSVLYNADNKPIIKGVIRDELGNPLPGASVVLKGTTRGAVTDLEGKFAIPVTPSDSLVNIAFIGYKSEEKNIKGQQELYLMLEPELVAMDEVVVIGYGVQKKSQVTGSVSSVPATRIRGIKNVLKGRTSGVEVDEAEEKENSGGQPILKNEQWGKTKLQVLDCLKAEDFLKSKELLTQLRNLSNKESNKDTIDEAMQLVEKFEFSKALKKIKKLEE